MNYFTAYLFTRLDSVGTFVEFLTVLGLVSLVIGLLGSLMYSIENDFPSKVWKLILKKGKYWAIFFVTIMLLLPSQKEAAFIYIAPAIVNNQNFKETIQQIPELSNLGLQYLNGLLENEIKTNEKVEK